jgi:hypothetical protein
MEARRDELELARVGFDVADREQADQPRANSQNIGLDRFAHSYLVTPAWPAPNFNWFESHADLRLMPLAGIAMRPNRSVKFYSGV